MKVVGVYFLLFDEIFQSNILKLIIHLPSGMVHKLNWCWQTRPTPLEVSQGGKLYYSICYAWFPISVL